MIHRLHVEKLVTPQAVCRARERAARANGRGRGISGTEAKGRCEEEMVFRMLLCNLQTVIEETEGHGPSISSQISGGELPNGDGQYVIT